MSGFSDAYDYSVTRRGRMKTWLLIISSPIRLAWLYTGIGVHAVGAFMMGDFHD